MAYTPIQTENTLEKVKLSYTTKEVFDVINNNSAEEDTRADRADAKFEAIEDKLDTIETDATKVEPSQTNGNIIINGTETPVYRLPQLTPSDVGADPAGTAASAVATHNSDENAHSYIQGLVSTAQQKADDAYALAEGRENATSYTNYQAMVTALNAESTATLKVGDNIYIETIGVPDLWVSDVLDSKASYTYTSDQAIVDALNNPSVGYINIGWYRLDELETAKVDLSDYVPTTTTVTGTGALGGGGALSQNRTIIHNAGSAPNVASGLYKISTDAYSHVSDTTAVATADLTPLLDGSYLAKANPTGTGKVQIGTGVLAGGNNSVAFGAGSLYGTCSVRSTEDYATSYILTNIQGTASSIKANRTVICYNDNGTYRYALVKTVSTSGQQTTVTTNTYLSATQIPNISSATFSNAASLGNNAFSCGSHNLAAGGRSFAGGLDNRVVGDNAFAYGEYLLADQRSQYVFGKYNVVDPYNQYGTHYGNEFGVYVEIVGNGTADNARSNARTLDWSGNETLAGNIKLGNHTTLANNSNSDITINLPSSAGTLALTTDIQTVTVSKSFTASDSRWSALSNGVYTLTINSATSGDEDVAGKHPFVCYNENNEQVMATLGFTSTTVYVKSDTKFAGTVYMI